MYSTSLSGLIIPILYALTFALSGVMISELVFSNQRFSRRLWLGFVLGLFMLTWLPSLFAFFIGFTLTAQIFALIVAIAGGGVCFILGRKRNLSHRLLKDVCPLLPLIAIFIVGCILFSTHIIETKNGSYYVGQTTHGDLSMHLGFISSIAEQGFFPPQYSIFAGHSMSYPFMCETSSSTMLLLGSSLRSAYLIPAIWAYALVILGVYNLFEVWLKRKWRSLFATVIFFVGGGFGFAYFFDLINGSNTTLSTLLSTSGSTNLNTLLTGFYKTPTNIPAIGLRWVNPIVDMLIPQRATLFGWAFLFPCLYLVLDFMKRNNRQNIIPLAIIAGGMPLIHTHSFVALAIISAVYFVWDLLKYKQNKDKIISWLIYAGIAVLLAVPQLVVFTLKQTTEGEMLRLSLNWANQLDSYLWFYIKNMGWIFILMPFAFFCLSKNDRKIYSGVLVLWLISEVMLFQPNNYDNNKLLFVWYAFSCGLVAKLLGYLYHKAKCYIKKHSTMRSRLSASQIAVSICCFILAGFLILKLILSSKEVSQYDLNFSTAYTIIVVLGFVLALLIGNIIRSIKLSKRFNTIISGASSLITALMLVYFLVNIFKRYTELTMPISDSMSALMCLLLIFIAILNIMGSVGINTDKKKMQNPWQRIALSLCGYALCITLFISGALTIIRELNSEYMAYDSNQIAAAEFVQKNTEPSDIFLTDYSWIMNPVSALSGRSIVCGPDTYLYYHGIDTTERKADIRQMYENPASNQLLFEKYHVAYVYIGANEYGCSEYECDVDFFEKSYNTVYDEGGIKIFDMNDPLI